MSATDTLGSLLFLSAAVVWAVAATYGFNYLLMGGGVEALGVSLGLTTMGVIPFGMALALGWFTW